MRKKKSDKNIPLVVCDEGGLFLYLSSTNRTGYRKSAEQGVLWAMHPDMDLPAPTGKEAPLRIIEDRETYYYAELSVADSLRSPEAGEAIAASVRPAPPPSSDAPAETSGPAEIDLQILRKLAGLITQRKKDPDAASYTARLFQSGLDTIRKKTGEEAVELILAREKDEVISEAADLLYHLMVLLEAEDLGLGPVLAELDRRSRPDRS
jgi:phosphoribosyl-ATP pyrophosphohydrolase